MKKNVVLVIGGGGRESTLVNKYSHSPQVSKILSIPGNDLMQINSRVPVKIYPQIKTTDIEQILKVCKKKNVDLVDVAIYSAI